MKETVRALCLSKAVIMWIGKRREEGREAAAKEQAFYRVKVNNDVAIVAIWGVSKPIKIPEQRKESSKVATVGLL